MDYSVFGRSWNAMFSGWCRWDRFFSAVRAM